MIYLHVPFCHRKCTYCAFYSVASQRFVHDYVDALLVEMEQRHDEQAHPITTVYFGGGTPSLLPFDQMARIVEGLRRWFDLSQLAEATIECNPEDLTPAYLDGLKQLGLFNRISLGIQSLDDGVLHLIGRHHTARQALDAVENTYRAGFHNISVDFIYGIGPIDNIDTIEIIDHITHISAYSLTVEEGTALAMQVQQGRVVLPDDDDVVRQYHALNQAFEAAGFRKYEVSNYARPGFESRHNSRYWDRTPYLGLGPAAHSFDGRCRRWNVNNVEAYVTDPVGSFSSEKLTSADAYNELLMTSLRTVKGLPLSAVPEEYKERLHREMQPYIDCGWINLKDNHYSPTDEGLLHADGIAAALFI